MRRALGFGLLLGLLRPLACVAQGADAVVHVDVRGSLTAFSGETPVVVWLSPLTPTAAPAGVAHTFTMKQRDKQFVPHLLVVPVGSLVDFPNLDPYFHNVFSLFNGRRFDLGLYETGHSQAVRFGREGVSYIFCNIHPEMGGIIVSLSTPYYAVSETGEVVLRGVPAGAYRLHVWSERATAESLEAAPRTVTLGVGRSDLGRVTLEAAPRGVREHANKFGEPYSPQAP